MSPSDDLTGLLILCTQYQHSGYPGHADELARAVPGLIDRIHADELARAVPGLIDRIHAAESAISRVLAGVGGMESAARSLAQCHARFGDPVVKERSETLLSIAEATRNDLEGTP